MFLHPCKERRHVNLKNSHGRRRSLEISSHFAPPPCAYPPFSPPLQPLWLEQHSLYPLSYPPRSFFRPQGAPTHWACLQREKMGEGAPPQRDINAFIDKHGAYIVAARKAESVIKRAQHTHTLPPPLRASCPFVSLEPRRGPAGTTVRAGRLRFHGLHRG